jgi:predicted nucleic-acid-binding Zn-ribbon protein
MSGCPKCGGAMEEGFVVDEGYGVASVSTWQGGPPKKSFWNGIQRDRQEQRQIMTYRCGKCGYLESFAR